MPAIQIQSFLGAGEIFFDRLTSAGVGQGYNAVGNALQFELSPDAELKELESRNPANYGQSIAAVTIPKSTKIKLKFTDFNAEALEMALMGTSTAINQSATTITDKVVTVKEGKWVEIGARNLSESGLVVKNSAGSTTHVKGTDYEINYALGMIKVLKGGAITDGSTVKVSGQALAYTGKSIKVGAETIIKANIKLDGKNLVDGRKCVVSANQCVFKPVGSIDFLKNDFGEVELEGTVVDSTVEWLD